MDALSASIGRRAALRRLTLALGGIATAPLASGLLSGCRTPAEGDLGGYAYRALSESQQSLLAALVDRILPPTDTPGAAEAGAPQFIDMMLAEWYAAEDRDRFLAGLDAVDARAEGGSFVALDGEAQAALVAALDAETFPPPEPPEPVDEDVASAAREGTYQAEEQEEQEVAGTQGDLGEAMTEADSAAADSAPPPEAPPFFRQLKELTLAGYYTSEVGATQELRWLAAPGRYDADAPLSEIGRAWA